MKILTACILAFLLTAPAWGRCALCREAAKSQRQEAIEALNAGILVLGAPPAVILSGIGYLLYRRMKGS